MRRIYSRSEKRQGVGKKGTVDLNKKAHKMVLC